MRKLRIALIALNLFNVLLVLAASLGVILWVRTRVPPAPAESLTIAFLEVGQGDAILVEGPSGRTLLVDGGDSRKVAEEVILPHLRRKGITRLDYVLLTHPHQDHVGGLPRVLEEVEVGAVVLSGEVHTNQAYERFLTLVKEKGITAIKARAGVELDLGPGVEAQVLAPSEPLLTTGSSVVNDNSVVVHLGFGEVSVLLLGDIEREGEKRILAGSAVLKAQILKVPHHGGDTSSTAEFLAAVQPEVAIISVGRNNPYGHPQPEVLERLRAGGAEIYRTDQHGTITIAIDGISYRVEMERDGGAG